MGTNVEGAAGRKGRSAIDGGASETDLQVQWARIRGRLKEEFGEAAFRSWLKALTLADIGGGRVRIAVPNRFHRDWVVSHYADRILTLWHGENSAIKSVEIMIGATGADIGSMLAQIEQGRINVFKPTPAQAKLAYLMLSMPGA